MRSETERTVTWKLHPSKMAETATLTPCCRTSRCRHNAYPVARTASSIRIVRLLGKEQIRGALPPLLPPLLPLHGLVDEDPRGLHRAFQPPVADIPHAPLGDPGAPPLDNERAEFAADVRLRAHPHPRPPRWRAGAPGPRVHPVLVIPGDEPSVRKDISLGLRHSPAVWHPPSAWHPRRPGGRRGAHHRRARAPEEGLGRGAGVAHDDAAGRGPRAPPAGLSRHSISTSSSSSPS